MSQLEQRLNLQSSAQSLSAGFYGRASEFLKSFTSNSAGRYRQHLLRQFPDVIELLAMALRGGVGYREALTWVHARCTGPVALELGEIVERLTAGDSVASALLQYESQQVNPLLRELALKLALADQLGTPVASQLVSLAATARAQWLTELREIGAKKETSLLLPLVFMVLPVTVLFAVYPSVQFLQFGSI